MTDRTEISDLMGGLITEELKQAYMNAAPILYEVKVDAPAGTPAYLAHPVSKFMDRAANAINAFSAGALSIYEGESLSNLLIITRGATNTLREPLAALRQALPDVTLTDGRKLDESQQEVVLAAVSQFEAFRERVLPVIAKIEAAQGRSPK